MLDSEEARDGAVATASGRLFHWGMVRGERSVVGTGSCGRAHHQRSRSWSSSSSSSGPLI